KHRIGAEQGEKVGGDNAARNVLRIFAGAEVVVFIRKRRQLLENLIVFSVVKKIEHRERVLWNTAFYVVSPNHHEAFRVIEGKWAKQDGIYNAEDCAVGPCPQHHGQYRNDAERGVLDKGSKAIAEVIE